VLAEDQRGGLQNLEERVVPVFNTMRDVTVRQNSNCLATKREADDAHNKNHHMMATTEVDFIVL